MTPFTFVQQKDVERHLQDKVKNGGNEAPVPPRPRWLQVWEKSNICRQAQLWLVNSLKKCWQAVFCSLILQGEWIQLLHFTTKMSWMYCWTRYFMAQMGFRSWLYNYCMDDRSHVSCHALRSIVTEHRWILWFSVEAATNLADFKDFC